MIRGFRNFINEKKVFVTFGRMNPPTRGHEYLLDKLAEMAGANPYMVFLSKTELNESNPLPYQKKIKYARKMFPRHARNIIESGDVRTIIDVAKKLHNEGYTTLNVVVGSDRKNAFETLLEKYNGTQYSFDIINVTSVGERDGYGIGGISASKQREYVKEDNFTSFTFGLPVSMSTEDAKKLFNDCRTSMGLTESRFDTRVSLNRSDTREKFYNGELFTVGEEVICKKTQDKMVVEYVGSNYLKVVNRSGSRKRVWIDDVETIPESVEIARNQNEQERARMSDRQQKERETQKRRADLRLDRARRRRTMEINRGIDERVLTPSEKDKKERVFDKLDDGYLKKKYGKNWKSIKYAIATKVAKS